MYINDSVNTAPKKSFSLAKKNDTTSTTAKTMTQSEFSKQLNPAVAVNKVNERAEPLRYKGDAQIMANPPSKQSNIFDNKYIMYGGIGLLALGLIYFVTKD